MTGEETAVKNEYVQESSYFSVAKDGIERLKANILSVIVIKPERLEYIIASKIAGGHVILADSHGVGKTSLARALAGSIEWGTAKESKDGIPIDQFSRIQCTVDLLPQDILGFNRFDMTSNRYMFNKGPIFAHFILCDEINLLTPKTQGSFFQAMEERMVSIEGKTYELPEPFFIIATMNLRGSHLFPLPAPQLDRFMTQISLGYPDHDKEIEILLKHGTERAWEGFAPVVDVREMFAWQKLVDLVTADTDAVEYIVQVIRKTRGYPGVITGASPRAGIKVLRLAKALALVRGINYITIDLIKELIKPCLSHRLELEDASQSPDAVLEAVMKEIRV
jgi:MoxR-like ATPase